MVDLIGEDAFCENVDIALAKVEQTETDIVSDTYPGVVCSSSLLR